MSVEVRDALENDLQSRAPELIAETIEKHVFGSYGGSCDIEKMAKLVAGWQSAEFYLQRMPHARIIRDRGALYDYALSLRPPTGLVAEFGVASGHTIKHFARKVAGTVYGFDSFQGLPDIWKGGSGIGAFAQERLPVVPDNVKLVVGLFRDTLPKFVAEHPEPVSLLHIDCDIYSSTWEIFYHLGARIAPSSILIFDEYFNYPGWQHHEHKAFSEWVEDSGVSFDYIAVRPDHQQVAVKIHANRRFRA